MNMSMFMSRLVIKDVSRWTHFTGHGHGGHEEKETFLPSVDSPSEKLSQRVKLLLLLLRCKLLDDCPPPGDDDGHRLSFFLCPDDDEHDGDELIPVPVPPPFSTDSVFFNLIGPGLDGRSHSMSEDERDMISVWIKEMIGFERNGMF